MFTAQEDCKVEGIQEFLEYHGTSWSNRITTTCTENGTDVCRSNTDCYYYNVTITENLDVSIGKKVADFSYIMNGRKFDDLDGTLCDGVLLFDSAHRSKKSGRCEFKVEEKFTGHDSALCNKLKSSSGIISLMLILVDGKSTKMQMNGDGKTINNFINNTKGHVQCDNLMTTRNDKYSMKILYITFIYSLDYNFSLYYNS